MDYETLDAILKAPETLCAGLVTAGVVAGSILGYISGRFNSKAKVELAKANRDVEVARAEAQKALYESERQKILASVDIKRLDVSDADNKHKRDLERLAVERQYQLEDERRRDEKEKEEQVRNVQLEQERYQRKIQEQQAEHQRQVKIMEGKQANRTALVQGLVELKPGLVAYLESARKIAESGIKDPAYEKLRMDYRKELVEKWHEKMEEGGEDIFDQNADEVENQVNRLVDFKYPPKEAAVPKLPLELERLVGLVVEE